MLTSFLAALTGCDGSEPAPDAGSGDAGSRDAGSRDGGPADSGPTDSGTADSGAADSGAADSGAVDSGATDSGAVDAGAVDAGDSGAVDGGMGDAGATASSFAGNFTDGASASTGVNAALDLTELTAEAWIRLDEMPTHGHLAAVRKGGVDNHVGYELGVHVRSLGPLGEAQLHAYVALGSSTGCDSLTALTLGEAHHIAFQRDAAGLVSLVVDGTVVACTSEAFTSASGFGLDVGDAEASRPFTGIIDEVRLSNVARYTTATYTPERHFTPDANTVGLWHFDEGTGTTAHDASSTGADMTISGAGFSWVSET